MIIGFFLFIFSPISFIVLFPGIFLGTDLLQSSNLYALTLKIHDLALNKTLIAYMASACGLGLVIGCTLAINGRDLILHWLREVSDVEFSIRSYELAWDHFLSKVKRYGEINLIQRNNPNRLDRYRLISFSTKSECKQLVLQSPGGNSDVLIVNLDDVDKIIVPMKSVKKRFLSESPMSVGTHLSLTGFGFLLIFFSFTKTAVFLQGYSFYGLSAWFLYASFVAVALSLAFFATSIFVLRLEYSSTLSAFVLCPWPFRIVVVGMILSFWAADYLIDANIVPPFWPWSPAITHTALVWFLFGLVVVAVVSLIWQLVMRRQLQGFFQDIIKDMEPRLDRDLVKSALWSVFLNVDMNRDDTRDPSIEQVVDELLDVEYAVDQAIRNEILRILRRLIMGPYRPFFLGREWICVVRAFLWSLTYGPRRVLRPVPDAPEAVPPATPQGAGNN